MEVKIWFACGAAGSTSQIASMRLVMVNQSVATFTHCYSPEVVELGILVWQDFQFACGVYPGNLEWFYESVRKEAVDNVRRLRTHPSIALFCGNNEDYQMILQWGGTNLFLRSFTRHDPR
jgi:hypothetical protein